MAKGLGLGLLCWGFKSVQEGIRSEEASTLQIGSVAFPPGKYTCPQLHPYHRLFKQDGHQDSSSAFHGSFQKLLERYNKCIATGGDYFEGD